MIQEARYSVVIPTYNNEGEIGRMVSHYSKHEVVVVDNQSTDKTMDIARSHGALVVVREKKRGIADCINQGLKLAHGEYILVARVGEYVDLEASEEADVVQMGRSDKAITSIGDALGYCDNSPLLLSKEMARGVRPFEDYYNECLNYRFILDAFAKGRKVLLRDSGIGGEVSDTIRERMRGVYLSKNEGELTCVIVFKEEREEVERTVASIRYMSKGVRILLVNDCSEDDYDYEGIARIYNTDYHFNTTSLGSAGGKNLGGNLVTTPYFTFFDAHMRLYHQDWDVRVVDLLREHPKAIISSRTCYMGEEDGEIKNERGLEGCGITGYSACCRVTMQGGYEFDPKWTDLMIDSEPTHLITPVACILGACYSFTKEWWDRIRGLEGLKVYGLEETYMSIKSWLLGGECLLVKDWGVGHIYRSKNACAVDYIFIHSNRLFIEMVFQGEVHGDTMKNRIGVLGYKKALSQVDSNKASSMREYIESNKVHDLEWFFNSINSKVGGMK